MIVSPNKHFSAGMSLGSKLDFFTVVTAADLSTATGSDNLNALIETIAINGQPVISALDFNVTNANKYTLKFAVEHTGAWTASTLQAAVVALSVDTVDASAYPYTYAGTTPFSDAVVTLNTL